MAITRLAAEVRLGTGTVKAWKHWASQIPNTPESAVQCQALTARAVLLHDDGWQRGDGSEVDEAHSAYAPIDIDGAGRTGKSGAYLSLRERHFAELMVRRCSVRDAITLRTRVGMSVRSANGHMGMCVPTRQAANSTRNHLGVVLQQLRTKGNAVEIGAGAGTGTFANVVLSTWDTPHYYIVDVNSGQDLPPLLDQHERRVEVRSRGRPRHVRTLYHCFTA